MSIGMTQGCANPAGLAFTIALNASVAALLLIASKTPNIATPIGPTLEAYFVEDMSDANELQPEPQRIVEPVALPQIAQPELTVATPVVPTERAIQLPPPPPTMVQPPVETQPTTTPAPTQPATQAAPAAGGEMSAKEQNYYAKLMDWLNRRKKYPREAKKSRQQGIVVVRFTIDKKGTVLDASIKQSSGFALLDEETLALMKRASPLPAIPDSLGKQQLTIALPIEYSLVTG